ARRSMRPPDQCTHARFELGQLERLGHVVVSPQVEPVYAILERLARGQYEHRHRVAACAQPFQYLETIQRRQADIEQHQPVLEGRERAIGLLAVVRHVDDVPALRQGARNGVGEHAIVLNQQDPQIKLRCTIPATEKYPPTMVTGARVCAANYYTKPTST